MYLFICFYHFLYIVYIIFLNLDQEVLFES